VVTCDFTSRREKALFYSLAEPALARPELPGATEIRSEAAGPLRIYPHSRESRRFPMPDTISETPLTFGAQRIIVRGRSRPQIAASEIAITASTLRNARRFSFSCCEKRDANCGGLPWRSAYFLELWNVSSGLTMNAIRLRKYGIADRLYKFNACRLNVYQHATRARRT